MTDHEELQRWRDFGQTVEHIASFLDDVVLHDLAERARFIREAA